ncbi:MAG TPA: cupin domain-containing protein [Burkholderiaceae bacterium]|nr:cupin domain-containing protein [Burkholderiaceae bacterium]
MQPVIDQPRPQPMPLPGIQHATWAGCDEGLSQLSLWRQTLAPDAGTPPHSHDCDEIVLCLSGQGELHIDGRVQPFGAHTTLVLPRGIAHQFFNTGTVPLETLGIFGSSPVGTFGPDGSRLELPWRS